MYLCSLFAVKMDILRRYTVPYKGLKIGSHHFDFDVDDALVQAFEGSEIKHCRAVVGVELLKAASMLTLDVSIRGEVTVECDRCLDDCVLPVVFDDRLLVKFSEQEIESDGSVMWIDRSDAEVQLGQYIYESIVLSLPYSRVHPEGECNPDMLARFRTVSSGELDEMEQRAGRDEMLDEANRKQWDKLAALKTEMEGNEKDS